MTIGFKTGPRNWEASKRIVLEDGARMCEVWFNVNKEKEYAEMFTWLREHEVAMGLHHWGLANGQYKTSLSTSNPAVREDTLEQMRHTIEIGREIGAAYVNVHPGAQWLERIDFATDEQERVEGSETSPEEARERLLSGAAELGVFANERGVVFTVETLPGREAHNSAKREGIYDSGNPPLAWIAEVGKRGGYIANDITHSAATIAVTDNSREGIWRELYAFTQRTAAFTKLIHVNTMIPPFDGRDSHNGLLPADFAEGGFPSRAHIIELLQIFSQRPDVFVVPEPQLEKTRENYLALKKIAQEAGVG